MTTSNNRKLYNQHCKELFERILRVRLPIITYSRPKNIGDYVTQARLHEGPHHPASKYLGEYKQGLNPWTFSPNFFVTLLRLLRSSRAVTKNCMLCIYLHFILYILTFCASARHHATRPNCDQFKVPMIPDGHWYSSIYTYLILFRTKGVYISDFIQNGRSFYFRRAVGSFSLPIFESIWFTFK